MSALVVYSLLGIAAFLALWLAAVETRLSRLERRDSPADPPETVL
jgi:ABC-type uncharacterized transport system permease subunit